MQPKSRSELLVFIIGAYVLSAIPFVHWPFSWLETYFHEISHGLAAIISGGSVERIVLHLKGSGLCYTVGGWEPLVSFAGYSGAIIWGAIIYLGARSPGGSSRWMAAVVLSLMIISGLLWARDIITILIMLVISGLLYASFTYVKGQLFHRLMAFSGIYVLVSAARSPLALIDGRDRGDGAALSDLTYIPEIIWVAVWSLMAIATLVVLWKMSGQQKTQ